MVIRFEVEATEQRTPDIFLAAFSLIHPSGRTYDWMASHKKFDKVGLSKWSNLRAQFHKQALEVLRHPMYEGKCSTFITRYDLGVYFRNPEDLVVFKLLFTYE